MTLSTYTIRFAPAIGVFLLAYTDRDGAEDWITTASNPQTLLDRCRDEPVIILPPPRGPTP